MRVLVVDDVAGLRHLVHVSLDNSGSFKVVGEARDGRDAIDKARALRPDLILLDLSMPTMDGMEALPLLLQASPLSKVVCLSSFESERMSPDALQRGAFACLERGMRPENLVAQLRELLGVA
jgi:DNA-binding NarL/FixJ family response regulator